MVDRNIAPGSDATFSIGKAAYRWLKGWFVDLHVDGDITDGTDSVTVAYLAGLTQLVKIASGSTVVSNNSETVVATLTGIGDGVGLVAAVGSRTNGVLYIFNGRTDHAPGSACCAWCIRKTGSDNEYDLRLRHQYGANNTLDWAVFSVNIS